MKLDSYERASLDIIESLRQDAMVFIINSIYFRLVIAAAATNRLDLYNKLSYQHISILEVVPNIFQEIYGALPYPSSKDLMTSNHFVTELVSQYGETWIPVASPDYQKALTTDFCDDISMVHWQRYIRAATSKNKKELTVLSLDPEEIVRTLAMSKLKTYE